MTSCTIIPDNLGSRHHQLIFIKRKLILRSSCPNSEHPLGAEQGFELWMSASEALLSRIQLSRWHHGVLIWQGSSFTRRRWSLEVWLCDVVHGINRLLTSGAEFFSFKTGSFRDWMSDGKQLFLSVFCLSSLVLFRGTKELFYGRKCQRMAVNVSEPHDSEQMLNKPCPGISHKRPWLLVLIHECGDGGATPGHSGRILWETPGLGPGLLGPRTSQNTVCTCLPFTSPNSAPCCPVLSSWNMQLPWKRKLFIPFAFVNLAKLGQMFLWDPGVSLEQGGNQFLTYCRTAQASWKRLNLQRLNIKCFLTFKH